jgi:hypothetical protein
MAEDSTLIVALVTVGYKIQWKMSVHKTNSGT